MQKFQAFLFSTLSVGVAAIGLAALLILATAAITFGMGVGAFLLRLLGL